VVDFDFLAVTGHAKFVSEFREHVCEKLVDLDKELVNAAMLGNSQIRDCELEKAVKSYQTGLSMCHKDRRDPNDPQKLDIEGNLARAYLLMGRAKDARDIFRRVVTGTSSPKGTILEANWTIRLGEAEKLLGNYEEARKHFLFANEVLVKYQYDRWRILAISDLGEIALIHGELEEAKGFFHGALELLQASANANNHYGTAVCWYKLGLIAHLQRDFEEAKRYYTQSLALNIKPTMYTTHIKAGILAFQVGSSLEAVDQLTRGIALCKEIMLCSSKTLEAQMQLALGCFVNGLKKDATEHYRELFGKLKTLQLKGAVDALVLDLKLVELIPEERRPTLDIVNKFKVKEQGNKHPFMGIFS